MKRLLFNAIISCFLFISGLCLSTPAKALPANWYASNSALADGRWQRIGITETGMHFISNTTLRQMGFNDPSKVNVYGCGGEMMSEGLTADMPDDLALQPVVRTAAGIVFFANNHISWRMSSFGDVPYEHIMNPYSNDTYYFLSDKEIKEQKSEMSGRKAAASEQAVTNFTARLVHEQDLQSPSETGRLLLGEDFRSPTSRTFDFAMPGNKGAATVLVNFGAHTSAGSSMLVFSSNGTTLSGETPDMIAGVTSEGGYLRTGKFIKTAPNPGERMQFGIKYSYSGALIQARLDYIEVFYNRDLTLTNGQLEFQTDKSADHCLELSGCSAETVIWDVTEPWNVRPVDFTLSGTKARFATGGGYHEYMAFNPSAVNRTVTTAGTVANQNIHGMPVPDMVIIAPSEYKAAAERLAALHRDIDKFEVVVVEPQQIYNEFSGGSPDVTAFRKMLKMWHDRSGADSCRLSHCLLMGRPIYDNKLVSAELKGLDYKPLLIWQNTDGYSETTSYSTDDYIAMLDDCPESSFTITTATMNVAVGRLPVRNAEEANLAVAKIEKYMLSDDYGIWRSRVLAIADDQDNGLHLRQTESVIDTMSQPGSGDDLHYEKLYLDAYPLEYTSVGAAYPKAKERMFSTLNEGVMLVHYIGHANPKSWTHENLLTWNDITSFSNRRLPWLIGATCSFGKWDTNSLSGAEVLTLDPNAGFIGAVTPSRTVYMAQNGQLSMNMARRIFSRDENGRSVTMGEVVRLGKNAMPGDDNKLRYCVIGDPALRLPKAAHKVEIASINGTDITGTDFDFPEIPALGRADISGVIRTPDGTIDTEFNGTIQLQMYDAEKAVSSHGNGAAGRVENYNDRQTRLTAATLEVRNGKWSGTLMMPSEIENNYSPARILAYAWSEKGVEATGHTTSLYAFGYNESAAPDMAGPEIEQFYINHNTFTDGDVVNSSPVIFAVISDDSGINLSDAGIGHRMSLTIDPGQHNTRTYDDLNRYFTQIAGKPGSGTIVYPVSEITPGDHVLTLTVWDNANNSTSADLNFKVGAALEPVIRDLYTDVNPATTDVTITVGIDRPNTPVTCRIEVFDMNGNRRWSQESRLTTDMQSAMTAKWDLCDSNGSRVPRGIYLYRATVETAEGTYTSKTNKLAVTAP